jgi:nucleotide-binding universal stress UspA family protein
MYKKILAPLDGSEFSECSLAHVKTIAQGCQVPEIILLRVVEPIHAADLGSYVEAGIDTAALMRDVEAAAQAYITRAAENLMKEGLPVKAEVATGWAGDTIMKYAEDNNIDLIIMSTHGRSGIGRWFMGSVAEKVVRHSHIPVLTVSPAGCRTSEPDK